MAMDPLHFRGVHRGGRRHRYFLDVWLHTKPAMMIVSASSAFRRGLRDIISAASPKD